MSTSQENYYCQVMIADPSLGFRRGHNANSYGDAQLIASRIYVREGEIMTIERFGIVLGDLVDQPQPQIIPAQYAVIRDNNLIDGDIEIRFEGNFFACQSFLEQQRVNHLAFGYSVSGSGDDRYNFDHESGISESFYIDEILPESFVDEFMSTDPIGGGAQQMSTSENLTQRYIVRYGDDCVLMRTDDLAGAMGTMYVNYLREISRGDVLPVLPTGYPREFVCWEFAGDGGRYWVEDTSPGASDPIPAQTIDDAPINIIPAPWYFGLDYSTGEVTDAERLLMRQQDLTYTASLEIWNAMGRDDLTPEQKRAELLRIHGKYNPYFPTE